MTDTDLSIPAFLDRTNALPAMVSRAAQTLASARTAAEVLEARDMASVAYDAAKRAARLTKAKGAHDELLSKVHRAQADALEIEAGAKRRLADEYDAAQERGEVRANGERSFSGPEKVSGPSVIPPKELHEARIIRDAEVASPGIVKATVEEAIASGEEPTRAKVRRAVIRTVKPEAAPISARPGRGRAAIIQRVREAITALSGLPPPHEVVNYLQGTDDAVLIGEHLPAAARWLAEFAEQWPEEASVAEAAE